MCAFYKHYEFNSVCLRISWYSCVVLTGAHMHGLTYAHGMKRSEEHIMTGMGNKHMIYIYMSGKNQTVEFLVSANTYIGDKMLWP